MMVHNVNTGMLGKLSDIKSSTDFFHKHYGFNFYKTIYGGFLSEQEMQQVLKGEELWFDQNEIERRLKLKYEKLYKQKDKKINNKNKKSY